MPLGSGNVGWGRNSTRGRVVQRLHQQASRNWANRTPEYRQRNLDYLRLLNQTKAPPETRTLGAFQGYMGFQPPPTGAPSLSGLGPGGGGRGYGGGGGGGGGGAPQMSQALIDQMLGLLGTQGPALKLQQTQLPTFRGQNLPAFNAQPYAEATNQLTGAFNADVANTQAATTRATQALQANYANPYSTAQVAAAPAAQQVGAGLQATAGGGGDAAMQAAQANAAASSDQASFANLLNVLGASDQAAQSSRLNQVQLDQNTALQGIGAQRRGLLGGITMAKSQAANQWRQQQAERQYQNSLMQQQWQREALMRNQDIANQQSQGNWQQRNEMINNRLTPLLQLMQGTAGNNKINWNALAPILQRWGK